MGIKGQGQTREDYPYQIVWLQLEKLSLARNQELRWSRDCMGQADTSPGFVLGAWARGTALERKTRASLVKT